MLKRTLLNLDVKYKLVLSTMVLIIISLCTVGFLIYNSTMNKFEMMLGKRLEHILRTSVLMINSEKHEELSDLLSIGEKDLDKTEAYKNIQSILKSIKKSNNLSTDIYTVITPDWNPNKMIFVTTSSDKHYIGNELELNSHVAEVMQTGQYQYSKTYEDSEGRWISAFAPIKNKEGAVIAVLEADYLAEKEIYATKLEILKIVLIPSCTVFLFSLFLSLINSKEITAPLKTLTDAVIEMEKGNLDIRVGEKYKDEIGRLGHAFNSMIIKVKNNNKLRDEKDKLLLENENSKKLAAIGELAAGVGHEINNPLAIGVGNLSVLKDKIMKENVNSIEQFKIISKIEMANDRIRSIVDGLRTFSRMDVDYDQILNTHELIEQTEIFIGSLLLEAGVTLTVDLKAAEYHISGNVGKFQQILMVLITNAKDALLSQENASIIIRTFNEYENIVIDIKDNGQGIPLDIQEKIFEPFFTTKAIGKGTGIGLGVIRTIVSDMNGRIKLNSEMGIGSTFSILLPVARPVEIECEEEQNRKKLSGNALVVDDEEGIRELLVYHLEELGLSVDEADSGISALNKVKEKQYDYICTDMRMTKMTGEEFIEASKKLPHGNCLYFIISGGVSVQKDKSIKDSFANGQLKKPFTEDGIYNLLSAFKKAS